MEKLSQREGTMFQFLLGDRSEFAPRLDAGAVWHRENTQQKAALPWPHGLPAVPASSSTVETACCRWDRKQVKT